MNTRKMVACILTFAVLFSLAGCSLPRRSITPTPTTGVEQLQMTFTPILVGSQSPTPVLQCTPPACAENEAYFCPDECPGGCGTVCATHTPAPDS